MANIVLIIGNGFDLDLKLESSYSAFTRNDKWKSLVNLVNDNYIGRFEKFRQYSLILHLQHAKETSNWFDIEQEIRAYIKNHCKSPDKITSIAHSEFDLLRERLKDYLKRVSNDYSTKKDSMAYNLLMVLNECHKSVNISSFNYTDCFKLCNIPYDRSSLTYTHIHNSIYDENIVLGCRLTRFDFSKRGFSFFYKSNMIQKANHLYENLIEAEEVIFFGHSMNWMDYCYFEDYFKFIGSPQGMPVRLTFITLDEKSERQIRDNIGEETIIALHNYLKSIDFIHTELVKNGKEKDCKDWESLLNRLKS